jgi:hypothetical protein
MRCASFNFVILVRAIIVFSLLKVGSYDLCWLVHVLLTKELKPQLSFQIECGGKGWIACQR